MDFKLTHLSQFVLDDDVDSYLPTSYNLLNSYIKAYIPNDTTVIYLKITFVNYEISIQEVTCIELSSCSILAKLLLFKGLG